MPIHMTDELPPQGKRVEWEVQIPGRVVWTIKVNAVSQEEAIAIATEQLDKDVNLEPDDAPEPELGDAEIMGWEDIEPAPEAA